MESARTIGYEKAKDRMKDAMASGTPWQKLDIKYVSVTDLIASFESCDSIGFSYQSFPFNTFDPAP